jgi:electron transfer flavoprotein beta subunit
MSTAHGIAVLVASARHPVSGTPCAAPNDVVALELARALTGGRPRTLHYGDPADPALPDYLAWGAPLLEVIPSQPQVQAAPALAAALAGSDIVICGMRGAAGTGMLPYVLAPLLGAPLLSDVLEVQLHPNGITVLQFLPRGRRRRVELPFPAVLAIHPLAPATPRYAYGRRRIGTVEVRSAVTPPSPDTGPVWHLEPRSRQPLPLRGADTRSGHARMLAAVAQVARSGELITTGSSADKARAVLEFMREHGLPHESPKDAP